METKTKTVKRTVKANKVTPTVKKTTTKKVVPATKKAGKVNEVELDTKNIKDTVKQVVQTEREIKYNYPEEIDNQLDRKAWRQKVRNKLRGLDRKLTKAEEGSKDRALIEKEIKAYRKEVLLVP